MTIPRFLRIATRNWQLKLLAVALAVLLWVVVSAEQMTTTWITIPVEVQEVDPSFRLIPESAPDEVRVRFVGPGREFLDLAVRRPSLVLRLRDVEGAEQAFELDRSMVRLPDGLEVTAADVEPQVFNLRFQQMASRELPVRIATAPGFGRGWTLVGPLQVTPARVRIYGPAERVAAVTSITTIPLSVENLDASFELVLPLALDSVGEIEPSTRSVRVTGRAERVIQRRFAALPVSVGQGFASRPTQVDLSVEGARTAVGQISATALRVVLAIDSIPDDVPPGGLRVPLRIEGLGPGIRATLTPATVSLLPTRMILDSLLPITLPFDSDSVGE